MRTLLGTFALVLWAALAGAQDHTQLVSDTKDALEAKGVSLTGACAAFQITTRVAWALRFEGAGLLDKSSGENCNGFAVAIVAYPNGKIVDMLYDAGNENRPQWLCCDTVDPARYRPAFDPADGPAPPSPPPVVNPPPSVPPPSLDVAALYAKLAELATHGDILRAEDTVRNEAANSRTQEQANTDAVRADIKSFWKDAGMFLLEKGLPAILAFLGGWKLAK